MNVIRNNPFVCNDVAGNPIGIIDFLNFCRLLKKEVLQDNPLVSIIDNIENLVSAANKRLNLSSRFPKSCYERKEVNGQYVIFPYGNSIFFSRKKKLVPNDQYIIFFMDNYYLTDSFLSPFLTDNSWREFVGVFYNYNE